MTDNIRQFIDRELKAGESVRDSWKSFFKSKRGEDIMQQSEAVVESALIAAIQNKHEAKLLSMENVVGVGVSLKTTTGKPTDTRCLTVMVEKKEAKNKLAKECLIPKKIDGVPTDVMEVGKIEALAFDTKVRPVQPGYTIGHYNITAGTFGCLVRDIRRCCCKLEKDCGCTPTREECPGDYLILSNNHVLANSNAASIGDAILQPGPFDGGEFPTDTIATLERYEEIVFGASGYNLIDAALARPTANRNVIAAITGLVVPTDISQAFPFDPVVKVGRTTMVTTGLVLATNATINVSYGLSGVAQFRHQIVTTAMAAGGDSGSLLMNFDLEAVGLLFAGSPQFTARIRSCRTY